MRIEGRFAVALTAYAVVLAGTAAALVLIVRSTLTAEQQSTFDAAFAASAGALLFVWCLIVAGVGIAVRAVFRRYVLEPQRLYEEAQVILWANPAHRIAAADWPEGILLGQLVNAFANRIQALQQDSDARIAAAQSEHAAMSTQEPQRLSPSDAPSRPTFYDFDVFHRQGQSAELDRCPLTRLSYTVFDTETTGLAPWQGDEIVSIGAVHIVNGKLLSDDVFQQFVNPGRRVPARATRVHGITNEMVEHAPPIELALPAFHRFGEQTVLVGHNAGFDLRFLQLKERKTGVRFDQPVLDTLMLSAVLYPSHSDHTLEAIARRLGITVVGRHTALGDALLTAEVFLKMIPLLRSKGISTLGEAREAASHTSYARLAY